MKLARYNIQDRFFPNKRKLKGKQTKFNKVPFDEIKRSKRSMHFC